MLCLRSHALIKGQYLPQGVRLEDHLGVRKHSYLPLGQLFRRILVDAAAPMGRLVLRIVGRRWTSMSIFDKS
jgi:hypothetical protein